ncbi:MAG: 2-isopropylmalate synthase [Deltaproteobacteria bacterium]|nr:2-isopropylmalate synthase [Deltaproteobacteria bacterium]
MSNRVHVFDTTLRDGEQSCGCSMNVPEKVRMARKLVELNVDVMEAGFPMASQGDFDAVDAIGREYAQVTVAALARCHTGDIERAAKALERAKRPRIHTFIATSPIHLKHKLKMTEDKALETAVKSVEFARRFVDEVEFSAEDATRTAPDILVKFARAVVDAGARIVNLPDTVGYSIPAEYGYLVGTVVRALDGKAEVSVHCHNDLGLSVANSIAAVQAGVRQVECTVNGIGERAGNCSLEEFVMALKVRNDILPFVTGIKTEELFPASQLLTEIIGVGVQPNKAIVGRNAFAHEAGIHQDGYLKERTTYEIMDPRSVGVPSSQLVVGKHSGRHAIADRCTHLGFRPTAEQLDAIYHRIIAVCDKKKWLTDDEIGNIARAAMQA